MQMCRHMCFPRSTKTDLIKIFAMTSSPADAAKSRSGTGKKLSAVGIKESDLDRLAGDAMKQTCLLANSSANSPGKMLAGFIKLRFDPVHTLQDHQGPWAYGIRYQKPLVNWI
jgi:hypothetical protein